MNEVLRNQPVEFGRHPGTIRTIFACRQNFYYPDRAQLFRMWVSSAEQCIKESGIVTRLTHSSLQNTNEHITRPEDAMQIVLVPERLPSGGYENIRTAMNVFSRYFSAYQIQQAKMIRQLSESNWTWLRMRNCRNCRQRSFSARDQNCIPSDQRSSWCPGNNTRTCLDKACAVKWNACTNTFLAEKNLQDWYRWTKVNVAQVFQPCRLKLQHTPPDICWVPI